MKIYLIIVGLVLLNSCGGIKKNTIYKDAKSAQIETKAVVYNFDSEALIRNIKTLSNDSFTGRRTGTNGAKKSKNFIIDAFTKQEVLPVFESFEQPFSFFTRGKSYKAVNVIGFIKGTAKSNKCIVISAHYDHEGVKSGEIYNGADDNASGTSALIAFAEYFKANPPKNNVILAAFDGEELGLQGAKYFVNNLTIPKQNIIINLNMDMISRSDSNELFAVGTRYNQEFKTIVKNHTKVGQVKLIRAHEGLDSGDNWTYSSDHAEFFKAKIPFIYFGVADHEDYHKPTDDFDKIDQLFFKNAVQTVFNIFKDIDNL